jgi:hypothetical protein
MQVFVQPAIFVDGKPNVPLTDEHPPWLVDAFKYNQVGVVRLDNNVAVLAVKTAKGVQVAESGDKISNDLMNGLVLEKKATNLLTWEVVEKMLQEREPK